LLEKSTGKTKGFKCEQGFFTVFHVWGRGKNVQKSRPLAKRKKRIRRLVERPGRYILKGDPKKDGNLVDHREMRARVKLQVDDTCWGRVW